MGPVWFGRAGALLVAFGCGAAVAQSSPSACGAPPIAAASSQANIFSDQQEEWLGDAMADMLDREYKPARDEAQSAYLQAIVDKLASNLPPTQIKFRVQVVDSSEINGFSLAGGHIYITRKLAAIAQNDDELAAVLGHEMGHIASHQFAFETTRDLKRLLGITSVGDRADVYAKFQKLMDARYKDKHPGKSGDDDEGQGEADKVGVYVTAAAGYRPKAFAEFWDRTFFVGGKTGGPLSDFFGITKPDQKRLRGMLKLVAALPPGCGATVSVASAGFLAWHESVVANKAVAGSAHLDAVAEVKLTPPLRMDLDQLRFSPDGKTILAQDEGSVFAIAREPYTVQFRFDAENALPARFSPDSQKIVFGTPGLHTEEWSLAEKKMLVAHEPITKHNCLDPKISPDGRTLVCVTFDVEAWQMSLALLDVASGAVVWEKKDFFRPSYLTALWMTYLHAEEYTGNWLPASFSADGNYLLIGPSDYKLAFDLRTRTPLKIGGDLKDKVTGSYAFIGSDMIGGVDNSNVKDSGLFSFPEGKQIKKLAFAFPGMAAVSGSDGNEYVLATGLKDYNVGLADLGVGKFVAGTKAWAIDAWNGYVTSENADGSVFLARMKDGVMSERQRLMLPLSPLGYPRTVAMSPDGKHLALSMGSRGGVWNLSTGKQEFLTRGFSNASWAEDGSLYAEFPKISTEDRNVRQLLVATRTVKKMSYTVDDKVHMEFGQLREWKKLSKGGWELTMRNIVDASALWTKTFVDGGPRYTQSFGTNDLLFSSELKLGSVKARLKESSALAAEAASVKVKENGRLIEVVDPATGKTVAEMVLELPINFDGTNGLNRVGDQLYMTASDNRTVVFSLTTGKQLRQIFGYVVAIDPETQRVCTVNRRDEAVVYDADGKELAHFHSGSPLRFASFQAKATQLVLLTADQSVRTVDVAKGDAGTAVAAN
jgi:WD40 repeat protein